MLDEVIDQAHGLLGFAAETPSRLLVVPATAQGGLAHRLLWLLARRLLRQGEVVMVIDGMADERPGEGLSARMASAVSAGAQRGAAWPSDGLEDGSGGIHILPGRQTLLSLANQTHALGQGVALKRIEQAMPLGVCVLLTAPPDVLAVLLQGTGARPLVPLDTQPRVLVEAYNAAKVLMQAGDLTPVLVPLAAAGPRHARGTPDALEALQAPVQALTRCAKAHLGIDLQAWPLAYDDDRSDTPAERVPEAWWLKVLDSALVFSSEGCEGCMALTPEVATQPESRRC